MSADFTTAVSMLLQGHEAFHRMDEPTPDDPTVLVSLSERDTLLLSMALPALEVFFYQNLGIRCFTEASDDLQGRMVELIRAQQPGWLSMPEDLGQDTIF